MSHYLQHPSFTYHGTGQVLPPPLPLCLLPLRSPGDKGPLVLRGESGRRGRRGGEWVEWNLRKYNMLDVSLLQEEYGDTEHLKDGNVGHYSDYLHKEIFIQYLL